MTVVVHVVGRADLGVPTGQTWTPERSEALVERRLRGLQDLGAAQAAQVLAGFTWGELDAEEVAGATAPLRQHLTSPGLAGGITTLVLLGTPVGTPGATGPTAAVMAEAVTARPDAFGAPVPRPVAVQIDGLHEQRNLATIADALRAALPEAAGHGPLISLTWGSGATAVALTSFAAALELSGNVQLVDAATGAVVDHTPYHWPLDPRISRYLQLGYPRLALAAAVATTPEQRDLLLEVAHRQELAAPGVAWEVVLAEHLAAALRRRDLTAGLAVRAGIRARYQQLRGPGEVDLCARAAGGNPEPTLGNAIRAAERIRAGHRTAAQAFLAAARELNRAGVESAHYLRALPADARRRAAELVGELRGHDDLPTRLAAHLLDVVPATPTGQVLLVWAVGGGTPIGPDLIGRGLGKQVLAHLAVQDDDPQAVAVHALLLATQDTQPAAQTQARQVEGLAPAGRHTTIGAVTADVLGPLMLGDHGGTRGTVRRHLERLAVPEAVVVAPTGPKAVLLPALLAVMEWAGQHGIPVFLRDLVRGDAAPTLHELPAHLGLDTAVAEMALQCARSVDLAAAARLLAAGSRRLEPARGQCTQLLEDFSPPVPGPGAAPQREAMISARLQLCHQAYQANDAHFGAAERLKLVHLAWTLVQASLTNARYEDLQVALNRVAPQRGRPLEAATPSQALRVLAVLREARNRLPTTHGGPGGPNTVRAALDAAADHYGVHHMHVGGLLALASEAVTREVLPGWPVRQEPDGQLADQHRDLVAALEELARP